MARNPLEGQGLLIIDAPRSHYLYPDTLHSVGLLWTSDQPDTENSISQHNTLKSQIPCSRRDSNPQSQQASGRFTDAFDRAANTISCLKVIIWNIAPENKHTHNWCRYQLRVLDHTYKKKSGKSSFLIVASMASTFYAAEVCQRELRRAAAT